MVTREMTLADGRVVRFRLQLLSEGEASALGDQQIFPLDVVEVFSSASDGDPGSAEFVGGRYAVEMLLEAEAAYRRHGLPLKAAEGRVCLSPKDTAWLLGRIEAGLVDSVEIRPLALSRPSALSA
jgi:hypothetical protein